MPGAIDNVYIDETRADSERIAYDVIGGEEPVSLCGSGLISLMSVLLEENIIDRSGHFIIRDDFNIRGEGNVSRENDENFFSLTGSVYITEDDILNLIRSKAAIYAGIKVLNNFMGLEADDIGHIYISGGFGRNLNTLHATSIGMFPQKADESFSFVGNSSLAGALKVLCDRTINPEEVATSIMNIELSANNAFMDEFIKACFLPHTDLTF